MPKAITDVLDEGVKYPNNGMVDSFGRLTPLAHKHLEEFRERYSRPMALLTATKPSLAARMRRQFRVGTYTIEDFHADVLADASRVIRRYDPDKGASVLTWLSGYIKFTAHRALGKIDRQVHARSLDAPLDSDNPEFTEASCLAAPEHDTGKDIDDRTRAADALRKMMPREREAMTLRYVEGVTLDEAARRMDTCRERVRQICHAAVSRVGRVRPPHWITPEHQRQKRMKKGTKPPQPCVRCSAVRSLRSRGLCRTCFYSPGVRDQYRPTGKRNSVPIGT